MKALTKTTNCTAEKVEVRYVNFSSAFEQIYPGATWPPEAGKIPRIFVITYLYSPEKHDSNEADKKKFFLQYYTIKSIVP